MVCIGVRLQNCCQQRLEFLGALQLLEHGKMT
jgi:hypothetical protein